MKVRKIDFGAYHGQDIVRPFNPNRCRLQFWRYHGPEEDHRRKHREKLVVTMDLSPEEVICAIQHLRRWLKDRVDAATKDLERGGYYRKGDDSMIYRPPED